MTEIDEAIKNYEKAAEEKEKQAIWLWSKEGNPNYDNCIEVAKKLRQLAKWLRKIKAYEEVDEETCEETEIIRVGKGVVKARRGRFVIYDVDWLKKNFYTTEEKIYGQPKQPCDDCVNREAVKAFLYERLDRLNDDELYDIFSKIIDDFYNELPSVTPSYNSVKTELDCISRDDAIELIAGADETDGNEPVFSGKQVIKMLKGLPPVTPKAESEDEE